MFTFEKSKIQERFNQCIESFKKSIAGLSAKVSPSLLDAIKCEVYGTTAPVSNFAGISVVDARTLSVKIWDTNAVQPIYKAIQTSNLGTNPVLEGQTIMLPLPPMSEERRNDMVEIVKHNAEQGRVAVRHVRRDENDVIKAAHKNKEISEDEMKRHETEIQKLVDDTIKKIDEIVKHKADELKKV